MNKLQQILLNKNSFNSVLKKVIKKSSFITYSKRYNVLYLSLNNVVLEFDSVLAVKISILLNCGAMLTGYISKYGGAYTKLYIPRKKESYLKLNKEYLK